MNTKKQLLFITIHIILICFTASCLGQNPNNRETAEYSNTTVYIDVNDTYKIDDKPLKILYLDNAYWGVPLNYKDNMSINFITLSELCKKKLGFTIDFERINDFNENQNNAFATYLKSGLKADLIFSTKNYNIGLKKDSSMYFWGDEYIEENIYMDLTPYLSQFCPEAILNFKRYPLIKEMCTVNEKVYALYTGMPEINVLALLVKNELLKKYNMDINTLNNFDAIYEFMDHICQGNELPAESDKIMLYPPRILFRYAMQKTGYYSVIPNNYDVLIKAKDDKYNPQPIEDTEVLIYLLEEFDKFFNHSYFTFNLNYEQLSSCKQSMFLTDNPLFEIKRFTRKDHDVFKNYSITLLEEQNTQIAGCNSIRLVMVPSTSAQPEKSLIFMQWLMTDDDVSDILTFGSQHKKLKHYTFSNDGIIIPEENNTIYGFCHLVANFSDKAFISGNKDFDIVNDYREMTYKAYYPELYKLIEAQHQRYTFVTDLYSKYMESYYKRTVYLDDKLKELAMNPDITINTDIMSIELNKLIDTEKMIEDYTEFIKKVSDPFSIYNTTR